YKAFNKAFANYEVQVNKTELLAMLKRRGFNAELSFGAFADEDLVAFTLNGIGTYNNKKTAYDTGTGTIEEYRGQGLAGEIFNYSIPYLKEAGVTQYLLEVLQHNTKAINVYEKIGFKISREFNYFVTEESSVNINEITPISDSQIREVSISECSNVDMFFDYSPSWQNSTESILRQSEAFRAIAAYQNSELIGFCITDPTSGDITQLAVKPTYRRKKIGVQLLNEAIKLNTHKEVKIVNTDTRDKVMIDFLKSVNIELSGKQFEMIRAI
ncbi:MAG: GNAT family N-acetyltransferase, partial [Desulfovibrionales bacterium]|nr:GNAT family N-acetyltransferase [Desulfovibrionales bacterium]